MIQFKCMSDVGVLCFHSPSHGRAYGYLKYFVSADSIPPELEGRIEPGWHGGAPLCKNDLDEYRQYLLNSGTLEGQIYEGTIDEYIQEHPEILDLIRFIER